MKKIEFTAAPVSSSVMPITFDPSLCVGCNRCASVCQVDNALPPAAQGIHPVVMSPGA